MYPYLLLLASIVFASTAQAQTNAVKTSTSKLDPQAKQYHLNVLTIAPAGLYKKVRLKYERGISENISLGICGSYHYNHYKGYKLEALVRYYFSMGYTRAPHGLYVQAKTAFGTFDYGTDATKLVPNALYYTAPTFTTYGGGLAVGGQWQMGKTKNWVVDINVGANYLKKPAKVVPVIGDYQPHIVAKWGAFTTPGFILDGTVGVGYAF